MEIALKIVKLKDKIKCTTEYKFQLLIFSNFNFTYKNMEAFKMFFQADGNDLTNIIMGASPAQKNISAL